VTTSKYFPDVCVVVFWFITLYSLVDGANVSEEHTASIFRVDMDQAVKIKLLKGFYVFTSRQSTVLLTSNLNMEADCPKRLHAVINRTAS
jgi:hypothetical protein